MLTITFDQQSCLDKKLAGGKGHGLAGMVQAGIPVAPGFVISTRVYRAYLAETGLGSRLEEALGALDRAQSSDVSNAAATIEAWFVDTPLPGQLLSAVAAGYRALCESVGIADISVAVRSSATAEDAEGASFAGEYETYIGLSGTEQVELHVRRCWASAFTDRALAYAWKMGLSPLDVEMAVVVQKVVNARAAGVMFTLSPVTGDRSRIVIEASYGLGLSVVGGEVTPDRFVVSKVEDIVLDRVLGDKRVEYVGDQTRRAVEEDRLGQLCLTENDVLALAQFGKQLERMHGCAQDIEFAIDNDLPAGRNIVLLQCRPETIWAAKARETGKSTALSVAAAMFAKAGRS
jgi:pyruvate, water dikinase